MLGRRLASAAVIITIMVLLLFADFYLGTENAISRHGVILFVLALVVSAAMADEFARMWAHMDALPSWLMMTAAAISTSLTFAPVWWRSYPTDCPIGHFGWTIAGLFAALLLFCGYEMRNYRAGVDAETGVITRRIGLGMFAMFFIAMLAGFIFPHRDIEHSNAMGIVAIVLLIATVKSSDAAAYFAGKSYGRKKLAPMLSPGKTVEGSLAAPVGGVVAAAIVVFAVAPLIMGVTVDKPWWWFVAYGIVVTLAGMFGDLAESLLKRDAACKDSSSWLPGLGGVLDVLDSLVFAAPFSLAMWQIG